VDDFVALQEGGKVINRSCRGTNYRGVAQAIGFALYEKVAGKTAA